MPTIILYEVGGACSYSGVTTGWRVVPDEIYDGAGSGVLTWTKELGILPTGASNEQAYIAVYSNGNRLTYGAEFTVTHNTAPNESTITITYPTPGQYYNIYVTYTS